MKKYFEHVLYDIIQILFCTRDAELNFVYMYDIQVHVIIILTCTA